MREIPGIPYRFKEPEFLELALSHRSTGSLNNERLEFLGDAQLAVGQHDKARRYYSRALAIGSSLAPSGVCTTSGWNWMA